MRLPKCITILFMIATICNVSSYASFNSCEKIDGDCPFCKHPFLAGHNPVAKVLLSSVDELVSSAEHVEDVLKNLSSSKNIQRFDNPKDRNGRRFEIIMLSELGLYVSYGARV